MSNFIVLALCLLAGMALRRSGRVGDAAPATVNALVLNVALPALTLAHLHGFRLDAAHLLPVAMPWLLFGLGAVLFLAVGRWMRLPRATVGALMLVGGLGNTSFVGLPMIESLQGRDGLALGLLIDQFGSYLLLSTVGLAVAASFSSEEPLSATVVLKRVATFPPFIAVAAALALSPWTLPAELRHALERIGDTVAPLALLSVGMQLRLGALGAHLRPLVLGLGYKLMACPALVVAVLWALDAAPGMPQRVSVIEAAMPPMIGAGVVAAQARLDAPLVTAMIGIGIPLGLSTVPAWHWLFGLLH